MSQLVIERNMPTSCLNCPCRSVGVDDISYCGLLATARVSFKARPKDCPLKELPPHGDLIDISEVVAVAERLRLRDSGEHFRSWEEYMYMALAIVFPVLGSSR